MEQSELKQLIEAILSVVNEPVTLARIAKVIPEDSAVENSDLKDAMTSLMDDYTDRSVELVKVGSGYRLQVKHAFAPYIRRLWEEKPPRYSRAVLETLAFIAYQQPVTRAEIEEVRGVAVSSQIIKSLQERDWVKVIGYREVPGRPALLATTKQFLDYFNLSHLSELPSVEATGDWDKAPEKLAAQLELDITSNTPAGEHDEAANDVAIEETEASAEEESSAENSATETTSATDIETDDNNAEFAEVEDDTEFTEDDAEIAEVEDDAEIAEVEDDAEIVENDIEHIPETSELIDD